CRSVEHGGARAAGVLVVLIGGQAVAVWLVSEAVDMRKSIDGLAQAVVDTLQRQPLSGEVFVFGNRGRDQASFRIQI
ncbi:MAG TPA: IS66 family insertion sequence element accessory protein TnpB, partial [Burkholderiaceae bacterium]|nr:IS66 family insertion sequence element accessory protein TnpB [Burkholderiaceae bacterium]